MTIQMADFHELRELPEGTVDKIIALHVAVRSKSPAIVMSKDAVLTYGVLGTQIAAFGAALAANRIGRSAKVAVMLPDGPELAVALVATACHAIAVPLNPKLTTAELDNLFTTLRIDAMVISERVGRTVRDLADRHGIRRFEATDSGLGTFQISAGSAATFTLQESEGTLARGAQPVDMAFILRTSATTGRPKLVPVTHRSLVIMAERRKFWFDLTPDDRGLFFKPLYYAAGLRALLETLLLGGSVVFPKRDADGDIIDWLVDLQPTWYHGGQTSFMEVLERLQMRRGRPLHHRLRFIRSGGAPLSEAVRQRIEEAFGVPVLEAYAVSEAGFVATNFIAAEHRKSGTVGRPWPNEAAIWSEDGRILPSGAAGEIVVRGPGVMPGYLDDEEANRTAFVDGWFRTGDLGSIDGEGFLTVLGRVKEFINRGGEKISPFEIERALLLHPCVREAAAFSVPHPRLGENVAAAVVLMLGATTTPREIKAFLSDHLAPFKIPQQVLVKAELPKGATGKTLRRALSEAAALCTRDVVPPFAPLHVQILEIWQRLIGRNDIGIDDDFFEAGGDSLLATQMVCDVEALTRQQIPPSALRAVFTVRELAETIVRGSPAAPELVTHAKRGHGTPFLFCHGDYGYRGFYALTLAEMLKSDNPVFLVHPQHGPDPRFTIEEMARAYVTHILTAHPTGAFCLGGLCNGGLLAWEIAHQLEHLGRKVEFVALIDTISLNARPVQRAVAKLIRMIAPVAPKQISEKLSLDGMDLVWAWKKGHFSFDLDRLRTVWHWVRRKGPSGPYSRVMSNYVPPRIKARVACLVCEESRAKIEYSSAPWTGLATDVHLVSIMGTHVSCITKHVGDVARALDKLLSEPQYH